MIYVELADSARWIRNSNGDAAMTFTEAELSLILHAVKFAADKHRHQRRKGTEELPYINHPVEVAEMLWTRGGVRDISIIVAAMLHDTIEDTDATPEEIGRRFGEDVLSLVLEVSDDKSLPKAVRKQLQIEHAPHISKGAKQIKMADKIMNIRDITHAPPVDWSLERRAEYLEWSDRVLGGLRGANKELEEYYDECMRVAKSKLHEEKSV
jgi:GTP diphosphokinase / guanosine-3',5'-bis(diphosphate) 3'-diphosphatase